MNSKFLTSRFRSSHPDDVLEQAYREPFPVRRSKKLSLPREDRSALRLEFDCPIRWSCGGVDRFGTARDASEIGAGFTVRSISQPCIGQEIRLVFELDGIYEWVVDERAIVTRCDPRPDGMTDVGVRLQPLNM